MPAYYPSCVVNLKLKFDETLHRDNGEALVSPLDITAQGGPTDVGGSDQPGILQREDRYVSFVLGRVPVSGSFELPGYRQAGKFSCEFMFRDLPIDPRTVSAAAVEVHFGVVSAEEFQAGMLDRSGGRRSSILQTRVDGRPRTDTLLMVGVVDNWRISDSGDGSSVSIDGRDLRGILLDTPLGVDPGADAYILEQLDLSQPIDSVVRSMLEYNTLFGGIPVVVNPAEWPGGVVPSPAAEDLVPRHRRGAKGQRAGGRAAPPGGGGKMSFWDAIVQFCYVCGAVPYFDGTDLKIRPSRSIFDQQRAGDPMNPTPFAGGVPRSIDALTGAGITPQLRYRRIVHGRDIYELTFDRKLAGLQRPKTIRTISVDNSSSERGTARVIQGRHPPESAEPARRQQRSPGQQRAQETVLNIPVPGVTSVDRLNKIAEAIYNEIGRGELGGSFTTKNLASFGGDNADADLLHLKPGDGVEIVVDARAPTTRSPISSALNRAASSSFEKQVEEVYRYTGDRNLARVVVATSRGEVQELQRFFRVSTVRYTWGDSGVQVAADFQNYVVSRAEVETGDETHTPGELQTSVVATQEGGL